MTELEQKKSKTVCYDKLHQVKVIQYSEAQEKFDVDELRQLKSEIDSCAHDGTAISSDERKRFQDAGKQLRDWINTISGVPSEIV